MTGPEHYREAERLLEIAGEAAEAMKGLRPPATGADLNAATQTMLALNSGAMVHATLALAAATAVREDPANHTMVPGPWARTVSS